MSLREEIPESPSESTEKMFGLCKSLYNSEEYSECLSILDGTNCSPSDPKLAYLKGKSLLKMENQAGAEEIFNCLLLASGKTRTGSQFRLGTIWKRRQNFHEAIKFFEQALKNNNSKISKMKIYCYLASCHLRLHDIEAAEKILKLADSSYRNEKVTACLAWVKFKKELYDEAINLIAACKISFETHPELYLKVKYMLALCLFNKTWHIEALSSLSEIPETDYHCICLSGVIYASAQQHSDARMYFKRAIEAFPQRWEAYYNLSYVLEKSEESEHFYNRAAELCPHELPCGQLFIPEIDIAEYIFEGKTSTVSHNNLSPVETKGIVVKKRSHEKDIDDFPMVPLIGLPMTPLPDDKKFTRDFMNKLTRYFQNAGKNIEFTEESFGKRNGKAINGPDIAKKQKR